jgi:hypothetical protein
MEKKATIFVAGFGRTSRFIGIPPHFATPGQPWMQVMHGYVLGSAEPFDIGKRNLEWLFDQAHDLQLVLPKALLGEFLPIASLR